MEKPAIIRHTAIRERIRETKGEYRDITFGEVRRIDGLLAGGPFVTELTGGGVYAVSDGEYLRITVKEAHAPEDRREFTLRAGESVAIDGQTFDCRLHEGPKATGKDRLCVRQSLFPLKIAFAGPGNRALFMEPLGMEGRSKKIARILKDAHIPREARGGVLIFFDCAGRPLWIPDCVLGAPVRTGEGPLYTVTRR